MQTGPMILHTQRTKATQIFLSQAYFWTFYFEICVFYWSENNIQGKCIRILLEHRGSTTDILGVIEIKYQCHWFTKKSLQTNLYYKMCKKCIILPSNDFLSKDMFIWFVPSKIIFWPLTRYFLELAENFHRLILWQIDSFLMKIKIYFLALAVISSVKKLFSNIWIKMPHWSDFYYIGRKWI